MTDRRARARQVLAFHVEAGVDIALNDEPADRFAESAREVPAATPPAGVRSAQAGRAPAPAPRGETARPPSRSTGRGAPAPTLPAAEEAVTAARASAAAARTLDELRAALERFEGCGLKFTAKQLVFADGNPRARVMFVGEAPGADEDREGLPFVGRAGKLLDRMLATIGLDRTRAYIANIVPWRPPGNRDPTPVETTVCLPFIRRQIELADPDILVCLGRPSMQTLLGVGEGIRSVRGRWFDFDTGTRTIRALVMLHPAFLLRSPLEKRHAWRDLLALKQALGDATPR